MLIWRQQRRFTAPELKRTLALVEPYTDICVDGFWAGTTWCAMTSVSDWDRVPPRQQTLIQLTLDPAVDDWNYDPTTGVLKTQLNRWDRRLAERSDLAQEHQGQRHWDLLQKFRDLWEDRLIRKTIQHHAIHNQ